MSEVEKLADRPRDQRPILIAEDSALLKKMIVDSISKSGYTNITATTDGKEAWEVLCSFRDDTTKPLASNVACVITDIEMPKMDGHRLTKLIKEDKILKQLPVIIFSSLIDTEMRIKGEGLGASAQVSKPEIGKLVGLIDQLVIGAKI